jgi:hypothetical protein
LDFALEMNLLLLKEYESLHLGYPDCSIWHWQNYPGWSWNFELRQNLKIGWYYMVEIFGRACRNLSNFLPSECGKWWLQKVCARKWLCSIFAWQDWENPQKLQAGVQGHSWVWHSAPPGVLPHTISHHAIVQTVACIQ